MRDWASYVLKLTIGIAKQSSHDCPCDPFINAINVDDVDEDEKW